uniref:RAB44, member RAS oncogene family n=1 Tax=Chelydra serpentina TaxID=8475 RepID=A0A8C3RTK7_CHESE
MNLRSSVSAEWWDGLGSKPLSPGVGRSVSHSQGRKLGSSRRKQLRDVFGGGKTSPIQEEEPFPPEVMEKVQDFFQECDKDQKGFITRADMQEDFPCSAAELELVFDGLDTDRNGYLTTEEFTTGLSRCHFTSFKPEWTILLSSLTSKRGELNVFLSLLSQSEIWRLWVKLRQDEPHLLGNLEEFLAMMTHRIKEAQSEKVTLELTLNKRVTDHNREVQQLYEEMEQQINREKQRLQHELANLTPSCWLLCGCLNWPPLLSSQLETQFHSLSTKQHAATSENQRLKENNQDLENQLQQIHVQLQETQGHLGAMRGRVSQPHSEEGRQVLLMFIGGIVPYGTYAKRKVACLSCGSAETSVQCCVFACPFMSYFLSPVHSTCHCILFCRALYGISFAPEADSGHRIRVVSTEEDPFTEFMKKGEAFFQQELSGQSSLLSELNDAIAALNKASEPQVPGTGDLLHGDASLHPARQGGDSEQRIKQVRDSEHQVLSRNDNEPKALPEAFSILSTNQATSQEEALQQGPTRADPHAQEVKQAQASEPATQDEAQKLTKKEVVYVEVQPPAVPEPALQASLHKQNPPEGGVLLPGVWQPGISEQAAPDEIQKWVSIKRDATTQPQNAGKPEVTRAEETRGDMDIFQQEEKRASSVKANEDAIPKLGGQANVTPEQPGGAATRTMETCPDPDHLYNVLFVGDSNVGKTSFLYRLHEDSFNPSLSATVGMDYRVKNLFVDNKCFALRLWDTAGQERYHSITKQFFRKADGVVLMYDVTSEYSFADVRYWLSCIQVAGDGIVILLLGNKTDCAAERQVSTEEGGRLAKVCAQIYWNLPSI